MVNGKEVEILESEDGCWRRKASKGRASWKGKNVFTKGNPSEGRQTRNMVNPMVGSGVQQTRKASCGASHQDGEKP
jgi:hypothetical protein